jgi:NAD+ kinase
MALAARGVLQRRRLAWRRGFNQDLAMAFPVRACALVGRFVDPRVAESVNALLPLLQKRKIQVLVSEDAVFLTEVRGVVRVPEREISKRIDLIIAIGGDGTLLYAAGLVAREKVPLLGINRGRLGFLTDVLPQDMLASVDDAIAGRLESDERPLLAARLSKTDGTIEEGLALNDVVLQKLTTGRMLDFETRVDGRYVNTHAGDGIIVASATGSTAYTLSCGGPIVEPHLDVIVMAPICPHTLSDRPIVVSGRSVIEVELLDHPDTRAEVTCDGRVLGCIEVGERLQVKTAAESMTLLHPSGYDYYELLRSKLHWGRGSVER